MNKTLTSEQTEQLFHFCQKHFVYHYDLQIELVDHLASSIESQWKVNPKISFSDALNKTFCTFGITGFSKIKQQKRRELRRKYNYMLWRFTFEFYRWPKMLFTLALTLGLTLLLREVNSMTWILVPYFALLLLGGLFYYYRYAKITYAVKTAPGKKFMLLEQLKQFQLGAILICQVPINFYNIFNDFELNLSDNIWILFSIAFLSVSLNIVLFGFFFYIPQKIKEHFYEQYSEFSL